MAETPLKTKWQQPIGPPVPDPAPAPRPARVTLRGSSVKVEPLTTAHADALYAAFFSGDEDQERVWTYLPEGPYSSLEAFTASIAAKEQSSDPLWFAIVDTRAESQSKAIGWASLMRIDVRHRVVEVGGILFSPSSLQRTSLATEAMFLMARYVFNDLRYRRYEWKCDDFNGPSKRAALRLGFTFEGVFRQHMVYKGRSRDTAWFSMLDSEWEGVIKKAFEGWLDPGNFDEDGMQRRRLEDVRGLMEGQRGPVVLQIEKERESLRYMIH